MNYKKIINDKLNLKKGHSSTVIGTIAGIAFGVVLGLLFAPKSGKETRESLCDATGDLLNRIKEKNTPKIAREFNDPFFGDTREKI